MKDDKQNNEKEIQDNIDKLNYPPNQDVFNHNKIDGTVDPENTSNKKTTPKDSEVKDLTDIIENPKMGGDLDVPGSELDDQQENIGSEDEENNYYSDADTK